MKSCLYRTPMARNSRLPLLFATPHLVMRAGTHGVLYIDTGGFKDLFLGVRMKVTVCY